MPRLAQVLCGDDNLARLIPAGRAVIRPCRLVEGPMCGLVPLQRPAVASSAGLRWNLGAWRRALLGRRLSRAGAVWLACGERGREGAFVRCWALLRSCQCTCCAAGVL